MHSQQENKDIRHEIRREFLEFAKMVVCFVIVFMAVKSWVIEGYEVQGSSMHPTLEDTDRILVFKLPHLLSGFEVFSWVDPFDQGDIVVFRSPGDQSKPYVKRVIAEGPAARSGNTVVAKHDDGLHPPDRVAVLIDEGKIYVNNALLEEPYLPSQAMSAHEHSDTVYLGSGDFYVLGDNRSISKDSRNFKAVHQDQIIGKAVLRFWPLSKFGLLQ